MRVSAAVRGDKMAIVSPDDARLPLLDTLLTHFDALVQQLARFEGLSALKAVAHRSSPMVAVYPGGRARYMRHVDNPDGNGRLLTCLYYLNLGWVEGDGGELRLWREEGDVYTATIPPLLDRCVLFWSDGRVPHEVLPANTERLAISVWFHHDTDYTTSKDDVGSQLDGNAAAMRAVAAAAAATKDDHDAWRRAQVLASGKEEERRQQQNVEDTYTAALKSAANTLRSKAAHVSIKTNDAQLVRSLASLQPLRSNSIEWRDNAQIGGKLKILLHQLMPSGNLAAGCTAVMLSSVVDGSSSGSHVQRARWRWCWWYCGCTMRRTVS